MMWHADVSALAAGAIYELAIVAETTRFLDYLARNSALAETLLVPDGSRKIFNTNEKLEGLLQLSLEMDDLALQISREQNRLLQYTTPSHLQIDEVLRKAIVPT